MLYIKGKMKVKRSAEDIMTLLKQGSEFSYKRKFSKRTFSFFIPAEASFWKNLDYCYVYGRIRKHQDHCEVSYTILPGIKLLVVLFFDVGDQNVCKYKLEELLINGYNPKYFGRYSD